MDWANELWVKVYTRETDDDLALSWEARAIWDRMMTKFDRSGIIHTKRGPRGLAALVRIPPNVVEERLPELLADGRVVEVENGYLAPNYVAAQDARKSDRLRQKEARDRARAKKLHLVTESDETVTKSDASESPVTKSDESADFERPGVTNGSNPSHGVTNRIDEKREEETRESPARARDPRSGVGSTEHGTAPQLAVVPRGTPPPSVPPSADPDVDRWCTERWNEMNAHRARIAAERKLEHRPLHPMDPGRRELALRMREGFTREDVTHAIAVAVREAEDSGSIDWLDGGLFKQHRLASAIAKTPGGRTQRAGPRGVADEPRRVIPKL
jgi:hypothetical protein